MVQIAAKKWAALLRLVRAPGLHVRLAAAIAVLVFAALTIATVVVIRVVADALVTTEGPSTVYDQLWPLWNYFVLIILVFGVLAASSSWLIAQWGLRPVRQLATAADAIAQSQRPDSAHLPEARNVRDPVGRLTRSFHDMIDALAHERQRQGRMIADASHELRTPLTSLTANLELLVRSERAGRSIPAADRDSLLQDLLEQVAELNTLVGELSVLAQEEVFVAHETVAFHLVVQEAAERARRRAAGRIVILDAAPWWVTDADQRSLSRAVINIFDNAIKFSPPGSTVRASLHEGLLLVDDEGPGMDEHERAHAFDRFWRSTSARSMRGSGLGLAIVKDAVTSMGGRVGVEVSPAGGARLMIQLPGSPKDPEQSGAAAPGSLTKDS